MAQQSQAQALLCQTLQEVAAALPALLGVAPLKITRQARNRAFVLHRTDLGSIHGHLKGPVNSVRIMPYTSWVFFVLGPKPKQNKSK